MFPAFLEVTSVLQYIYVIVHDNGSQSGDIFFTSAKGGYAFTIVCLLFRLSVRWITKKSHKRNLTKFFGGMGCGRAALETIHKILDREPDHNRHGKEKKTGRCA